MEWKEVGNMVSFIELIWWVCQSRKENAKMIIIEYESNSFFSVSLLSFFIFYFLFLFNLEMNE